MNLFPSNGCVYSSGGGGSGFFSMEGLNSSGGTRVIIDNVGLRDRDMVSPVSGLGNSKLLYVFGNAVGDVDVTGRILLGPSGVSGNGISSVKRFFEKNRVFNSGKGVNLSVPGAVYKIRIVGFALGSSEPAYNIQTFIISGLIADPTS